MLIPMALLVACGLIFFYLVPDTDGTEIVKSDRSFRRGTSRQIIRKRRIKRKH
jgi:hypothetical protein